MKNRIFIKVLCITVSILLFNACYNKNAINTGKEKAKLFSKGQSTSLNKNIRTTESSPTIPKLRIEDGVLVNDKSIRQFKNNWRDEGILIYSKTIKLKKASSLLDICYGDVDGDGIKDTVMLISQHDNIDYVGEATLSDGIILVQYGKSKHFKRILLRELERSVDTPIEGREGGVQTHDFNGDKKDEILLSVGIDSCGGAGQYQFRIISLKNNRVDMLFGKQDYYIGFKYIPQLMDNYKLRLSLKNYNSSSIIDLRKEPKEILNNYYNKKGKVINNHFGNYDAFCSFDAIDYDKDSIFEIDAGQYIWDGESHVDGLGIEHAIIKWNSQKGEWVVKRLYFKPF